MLFRAFLGLEMTRPRVLGFGVGKEPLPVAFARQGASVLATDQAAATAFSWRESGQWGGAEHFGGHNLAFREVDMRSIPADLDGRFDVLWSACALEHLGGLLAGEKFVLDAMRCLKPGGIALHTTEFNVSHEFRTVDEQNLCFYRRNDLDRMFRRLADAGHRVFEPDWSRVKLVGPPGPQNRPHLAFQFGDFVTTSFFFAVQRNS